MFDRFNDSLALRHIGTCSKSDCITFLTGRKKSMRLVCIAPRSKPVDKDLELSRHICPIRRRHADDFICFGKFRNQLIYVIINYARSGRVTLTATFAVLDFVVVYANCRNFVIGRKMFRYQSNYFGRSAVTNGARIDYKEFSLQNLPFTCCRHL